MTRQALRARGKAEAQAIFGDGAAALANPAAGFGDLMAELVHGSIWTRPGLGRQDRMACTLAALVAMQNWTQLRRHVAAALRIGLDPRAVTEVLIQTGIYRGFAASETALEVALHGARKDEAHAAPDNPVTGSIYPLVVQHAYGEIWDRPGLDKRIRALVAVAAFAALDHETLLRKFSLSALNVGATQAEVIEAVVQIGPYAGFAFMLKGLTVVGEAFGPAQSS
jgi:4-carboxymuconolactone decarboxylase